MASVSKTCAEITAARDALLRALLELGSTLGKPRAWAESFFAEG